MPCRALPPFPPKATTHGWRATWSGLRARRHAPNTTCSWRRRGSQVCADELIRLGAAPSGLTGPLFIQPPRETVCKFLSTSQPPHHQACHRRVNERLTSRAQPFVVLTHPPVLIDPSERALHYPSTW